MIGSARSKDTANRDEKHGRAHRVESLSQSQLRESKASASSRNGSPIGGFGFPKIAFQPKREDDSESKVSWDLIHKLTQPKDKQIATPFTAVAPEPKPEESPS